MSPGPQDQPETEVRRPRGWLLCALYVLATAPLIAGIILAFAQLRARLSTAGTIDLESHLDSGLLLILQCLVAFSIPLAVFLIFRARFPVPPAVPVEVESSFLTMCWAFAGFLLCIALLVAAEHLGIYAEPRDSIDLFIPGLAFIFGQWQLRALLNPLGIPPGGPNEAADRDRSGISGRRRSDVR